MWFRYYNQWFPSFKITRNSYFEREISLVFWFALLPVRSWWPHQDVTPPVPVINDVTISICVIIQKVITPFGVLAQGLTAWNRGYVWVALNDVTPIVAIGFNKVLESKLVELFWFRPMLCWRNSNFLRGSLDLTFGIQTWLALEGQQTDCNSFGSRACSHHRFYTVAGPYQR